MRLLRVFIFLFALINSETLLARSKNTDEVTSLKTYTENLISDGYNVMNDPKLSEDDRLKYSTEIIERNLYLSWMAEYSLGRYRKSISQDKLQEFTRIYSKFVIKAYSDLAKGYNGEKAVVKDVRELDVNLFMVDTEILTPGSPVPLKVEYLVHKMDIKNGSDPYRVGDVITEGVSILNSQQSEFGSILASQGIDALIDNLKHKLTQNSK